MKPVRRTGIIRQRGQLTIPEAIRKVAKWARNFSVVSVSLESPDEISIKPHGKEEIDWEKLWKDMERVRAFRGQKEQKVSLSEFIAHDRLQRR